MKKLFAVIMALCLFASLLSLTAMAENPSVKVSFRNAGVGSNATTTFKPGDSAYIITNDDQVFAKWTGDTAPEDKYIKVEYPAEGEAVLNVTFKNIDFKNEASADWTNHAIEFPKGEYKVVITLEGESKVQAGSVSFIKCAASGGMTITGSGKLITNQIGSANGTIWMTKNAGDLLIKDTNLDMTVSPGSNSLHHCILSNNGNVTFENVKLTMHTKGGSLVYFGEPQASGDQVGRYTPDGNTDRKVTIKDCEMTLTGSKVLITTAAPAVISNSTLKLTTSTAPIFSPAPTFEGDYTAIAGLAKNADKLDKLKEYQASKLSSYTYIYIVPGIVDLLPTETEPEVTVPTVTEPTPIVPDATEPTPIVPDVTTPEASTPSATTPTESKPTTNAPSATQPAGDSTDNTDKTDDATQTDNTDKKNDGEKNPLVVVLIVLIIVVVAVGATFGVLFYLKKKKAQ